MFEIRLIDRRGIFRVHHDGDKASARLRARRLAERTYPAARGYTHRGLGKESDCVTVFRAGDRWVADCAVEPMDGGE